MAARIRGCLQVARACAAGAVRASAAVTQCRAYGSTPELQGRLRLASGVHPLRELFLQAVRAQIGAAYVEHGEPEFARPMPVFETLTDMTAADQDARVAAHIAELKALRTDMIGLQRDYAAWDACAANLARLTVDVGRIDLALEVVAELVQTEAQSDSTVARPTRTQPYVVLIQALIDDNRIEDARKLVGGLSTSCPVGPECLIPFFECFVRTRDKTVLAGALEDVNNLGVRLTHEMLNAILGVYFAHETGAEARHTALQLLKMASKEDIHPSTLATVFGAAQSERDLTFAIRFFPKHAHTEDTTVALVDACARLGYALTSARMLVQKVQRKTGVYGGTALNRLLHHLVAADTRETLQLALSLYDDMFKGAGHVTDDVMASLMIACARRGEKSRADLLWWSLHKRTGLQHIHSLVEACGVLQRTVKLNQLARQAAIQLEQDPALMESFVRAWMNAGCMDRALQLCFNVEHGERLLLAMLGSTNTAEQTQGALEMATNMCVALEIPVSRQLTTAMLDAVARTKGMNVSPAGIRSETPYASGELMRALEGLPMTGLRRRDFRYAVRVAVRRSLQRVVDECIELLHRDDHGSGMLESLPADAFRCHGDRQQSA